MQHSEVSDASIAFSPRYSQWHKYNSGSLSYFWNRFFSRTWGQRAAIATTIGRTIGVLYLAYVLFQGNNRLKLR